MDLDNQEVNKDQPDIELFEAYPEDDQSTFDRYTSASPSSLYLTNSSARFSPHAEETGRDIKREREGEEETVTKRRKITLSPVSQIPAFFCYLFRAGC